MGRAPRADVGAKDEDARAAGARDEGEPATSGSDESGWARDPATGECSFYVARDAAPSGWLRFDSDIECRCSSQSCPSTIEEAELSLCAVTSPPANVQRFVGCGLVAVVGYAGYREWTFEQPSASGGSATRAPRLVGAAQYGAGSLDAGSPSSWSAGVDPAHCHYASATELCQVCGDDPATDYPPCQ